MTANRKPAISSRVSEPTPTDRARDTVLAAFRHATRNLSDKQRAQTADEVREALEGETFFEVRSEELAVMLGVDVEEMGGRS